MFKSIPTVKVVKDEAGRPAGARDRNCARRPAASWLCLRARVFGKMMDEMRLGLPGFCTDGGMATCFQQALGVVCSRQDSTESYDMFGRIQAFSTISGRRHFMSRGIFKEPTKSGQCPA